jgi:hypothetical protein
MFWVSQELNWSDDAGKKTIFLILLIAVLIVKGHEYLKAFQDK